MKPDNFEQELQRQPLRPIPGDWREQILGACVRKQAAVEAASVPAWRLLFLRFPVAWGAFAALWVAIVSINALLIRSDTPVTPRQVAVSSFQSLAAWNHRSAVLQQLASDDQAVEAAAPAPPPVMNLNSPRSERRRGWQWREVLRDTSLTA
jgi:hypothetical protein